MIPLNWYLILSAVLFAIGLYGALTRKNAVIILIAIEVMMNAVNVNLAAFWRYLGAEGGAAPPHAYTGQMFTLFSITIAGAEAAVGLAIVIAVFRALRSIDVAQVKELKG